MEIKLTEIKINEHTFFTVNKQFSLGYPFFDLCLININGVIVPQLCITDAISEEDYDYNYNDELEYSGLSHSITYYPIRYNPFNSKEISYKIVETVDYSEEYNNLTSQLNELEKKRKTTNNISKTAWTRMERDKLLSFLPPIFLYDKKDKDKAYNLQWDAIFVDDIIERNGNI